MEGFFETTETFGESQEKGRPIYGSWQGLEEDKPLYGSWQDNQ